MYKIFRYLYFNNNTILRITLNSNELVVWYSINYDIIMTIKIKLLQ